MNKLFFFLMVIVHLFFYNPLHSGRRVSLRLAQKRDILKDSSSEESFQARISSEVDDERSSNKSESEENDYENNKKKVKKLICPFEGLCKRADSKKPFQTPLTLHMHIVSVHVECPYGESFESCHSWDVIKKEIVKAFEYEVDLSNMDALKIHTTLKQELRVPLRDHVLDRHMGFCRDGRCSYIDACTNCKKIVTLARTVMKNHSCLNLSKKKTERIAQSGSKSENLSDCDETDLDYDLTDVELSSDDGDGSCYWNSETSESKESGPHKEFHTNIDGSSIYLTDSKFESEKKVFFSCWLKNYDIAPRKYESVAVWRARLCSAELSDHAAAIEHLQTMHNVCFKCMEKKAFFSSAENLGAHENRFHDGEAANGSKCLTYGGKAVCLLCVIRNCKYQNLKKLALHMKQEH